MTILIAVISYLLAPGRWAIGLSAAISMRDRPHPRALKKKLLAELQFPSCVANILH
jgi:hypothetical protein